MIAKSIASLIILLHEIPGNCETLTVQRKRFRSIIKTFVNDPVPSLDAIGLKCLDNLPDDHMDD